MKDQVIKIINRHINDLLREKEKAKNDSNLLQLLAIQQSIDILTKIVTEIQDTT